MGKGSLGLEKLQVSLIGGVSEVNVGFNRGHRKGMFYSLLLFRKHPWEQPAR
jgi:hypothetical protein